MPAQELNVKFKVDSSELKSGSDEAKRKVAATASEMESEVRAAGRSMEDHLDAVAESAKNIGDAAKDAGDGVKALESQVSGSSGKMAADLGKVAEEAKKLSARQMGAVASRALGLASQAVGWVGNTFTEEGTEERLWADTAGGALSGAASGAALGTMLAPGVGTAIGAAAGALAGSAAKLYEAGKKLEEAAEEQRAKSERALQDAQGRLYDERRLRSYERENRRYLENLAEEPVGSNPYRAVDEAREERERREQAVRRAQRERDEFVDAHYLDTGDAAVASATRLEALDHAVQVAQERLAAFSPVVAEAARVEAALIQAEEAAEREAGEAARRLPQRRRRRPRPGPGRRRRHRRRRPHAARRRRGCARSRGRRRRAWRKPRGSFRASCPGPSLGRARRTACPGSGAAPDTPPTTTPRRPCSGGSRTGSRPLPGSRRGSLTTSCPRWTS